MDAWRTDAKLLCLFPWYLWKKFESISASIARIMITKSSHGFKSGLWKQQCSLREWRCLLNVNTVPAAGIIAHHQPQNAVSRAASCRWLAASTTNPLPVTLKQFYLLATVFKQPQMVLCQLCQHVWLTYSVRILRWSLWRSQFLIQTNFPNKIKLPKLPVSLVAALRFT